MINRFLLNKFIQFYNNLEETVSAISSDPLCNAPAIQNGTLETFIDQKSGGYCRFSRFKSVQLHLAKSL